MPRGRKVAYTVPRAALRTGLTAALAVALAAAGTASAAGEPGPGLPGIIGLVDTARLAEAVDGAVNVGRTGHDRLTEGNRVAWARGTFAAPGDSGARSALTYDRRLVPAGATVEVAQFNGRRGMTITLGVQGLPEGRGYGAHVHTGPCTADPAAAGSRYQNVRDPRTRVTSPDFRYTNPENEVWLDFTTDEKGEGEAVSGHSWHFRAGEARSVVVYEHRTRRDPAHAGAAGRRVACVTVPFDPAGRG
ncbi:superoxide dismutase family protein [Streptomyces sp. TRM43335]|uniref:Superoxide dismutase family protein n=1 Tax=Streptomyces taklimakanensis TaxID=2569853 RepID=A0A6G2B9P0_9ACTN|nr:superoxide dismutase family protein [Streptomyces taklimakanensis]MTE18846.1 superoxide dismutase family protein [Streptomyces taklimakanensis]